MTSLDLMSGGQLSKTYTHTHTHKNAGFTNTTLTSDKCVSFHFPHSIFTSKTNENTGFHTIR